MDSKSQNKKNIEFYLIPTKGTEKVDKTLQLIDILNPYLCIVFCNSRDNADGGKFTQSSLELKLA